MIIPLAVASTLLTAALATSALGASSPGASSPVPVPVVAVAPAPAAAPATGSLVTVGIPAVVVVRVEGGLVVSAWTNTGTAPVGTGDVYLTIGAERRLASEAERLTLTRCAATAPAAWTPGSPVMLTGPACRL